MTGTAFFVPARRTVENQPPLAISVAFLAFVAALLAGVGEAIVYVTRALTDADADVGDLVPGLLMRTGIYLIVLLVAIRMTHGDRWARIVLTIGIGVVGLASLIIEPIGALLSADDFGDLFAGITADSVLIGILRGIHIVAVLIAIPAMYRPDARAYFGSRSAA
ncbi:hypothetical protein [Nocardia sp. NPDC052566]|uniref:hypothetical protein n=1 Tax=Nocardia sp. NPDC052566 TaxID=3364330 RepID=UPI0037CA6386